MEHNGQASPSLPLVLSFGAGVGAGLVARDLFFRAFGQSPARTNADAGADAGARRLSHAGASTSQPGDGRAKQHLREGEGGISSKSGTFVDDIFSHFSSSALDLPEAGRAARGAALETTPSLIPSDINLPEQVFGEQVSDGSPYDRPEVLDFPTYAACRFLDTAPTNPENGDIFEALKTISAYYLRADARSICECIQAFGLNDVLFSIVRLERLFSRSRDSSPKKRGMHQSGQAGTWDCAPCDALGNGGATSGRSSLDSPRDLPKDICAVKQVVGALMHEIECILHEYLSFNWDRVEDVFEANSFYLEETGLKCLWKSKSNLQSSSGSSGSLGASPQASSSGILASMSSDQGDASYSNSPTSTSGSLPSGFEQVETFQEYLAARRTQSTNGSVHGGSAQRAPDATKMTRSHLRAIRNWKRAKYAVTKKITQDMLGVQRRFQTLVEMFSELNRNDSSTRQPPQRGPVLLLLGGGMAAGKSTVREIIGHDDFWSKVGKDAVIIEADAIKNRDAMYKHLSSWDLTRDDPTLSSYVHEYSTKAAETLLAAAVNMQKDIVFDGTMTWAPFVEQTIAMVRDHHSSYRRGPGYCTDANGRVIERYWEIDHKAAMAEVKRPYRIELVGVTCDAGLAVARGIWRKLRTGRSVPIPSQLRSHRLFSENFERLAHLVDSATLYHTGSALTTFNKGGVNLNPKVIAHRSSATRGEMLVNSKAYRQFCHKANINDEARCRGELFLDSARDGDKVPISHEEQMSTLRQVFQAADRRERQQRRQPKQHQHPAAPTQHEAAGASSHGAANVAAAAADGAAGDTEAVTGTADVDAAAWAPGHALAAAAPSLAIGVDAASMRCASSSL